MRSSGDTELVSSISKAADAVTAVKYLALQARALEDEQDVLRKKELLEALSDSFYLAKKLKFVSA